ncbi:MAG: hypothetical protein WCO06_04960 [Candidatus Roizmanbacteria bacterium]
MRFYNDKRGQSVTILLVFMVVVITVTSASVAMMLTNSLAGSTMQRGTLVLYASESGAENAIMRLLRNPNYAGETMTIDGINVVIGVNTPTTTLKVITSTATLNGIKRVLEVQLLNTDGIFGINSWKEIN